MMPDKLSAGVGGVNLDKTVLFAGYQRGKIKSGNVIEFEGSCFLDLEETEVRAGCTVTAVFSKYAEKWFDKNFS